MLRIKRGFKLVYTGRKYRQLRKENPEITKEVFVDIEDKDEINYMIGVNLTDPHVKIYLQYSDGTEQRIKLHERYFYDIIRIIRNLIKYKKMYLELLFYRGRNR